MYKGGLYRSVVEIDLEATRLWYARGERWGCDCASCRKFLELAEKKELPEEILECLERFGIRPEQATYVCELYEDEAGHHYQFSYRLAGNLIEEGE